MKKLTDEQLLGEIEELIRMAPIAGEYDPDDRDFMEWQARVAVILKRWDPIAGVYADADLSAMRHDLHPISIDGHRNVMSKLQQARYDLRLRTGGAMSIAVGAGSPYEYFDAIRKLIEEARTDLLFVDRYMDAEFVSKFMGHVAKGTAVRLLSRDRLASLIPAARAFTEQNGLAISIRSTDAIHDRYVFIDRRTGYVSGASFKDGGRKSPTAVTQILDAFAPTLATYEALWDGATVQV